VKKAIVTLTVGRKYVSSFSRHCLRPWKAYASRNGFDLIVLDASLDASSRAQARSPAWQKCLILSHRDVRGYDQVVWVDSDVLINPASPDICADVPLEKIGAVDAYSTPNKDDYQTILRRKYETWTKQNVPFVRNLTASEYHETYGLAAGLRGVVQSGVLVLSPSHHRDLLEHVYHAYEERGEALWNYEMRPLSYEIQRNGLEIWLNPKFNMIWPTLVQCHYPFLTRINTSLAERVARRLGFPRNRRLLRQCATTAFLNNYFLHFSGSSEQIGYVDTGVDSVFDL
jgi:hypothetical protein